MNTSHRLTLTIPILLLAACTTTPDLMTTRSAEPPQAPTIELPTDPITITIHQRQSAVIPGSDGKIRIYLDDITAGQVMISILRDGNDPLIEPRSICRGDVLEVPITRKKGKAEKPLYLKITQLHNFLVGDDVAEIAISGEVLWREEFGPEYVAPVDTAHQMIDGVEYEYIANSERREQILAGFRQLQIGMDRQRVRQLMGPPDQARASYGKRYNDFHGWYYQYVLRDRDLNVANMKDELVEVFFDKHGLLNWAVPSNIPGLSEIGSPRVGSQEP